MNTERRIRDPRGQRVTIVKVETSSGPTMITKSCGHRSGYVNHFMYTVGAHIHCFECKDYYPDELSDTTRPPRTPDAFTPAYEGEEP